MEITDDDQAPVHSPLNQSITRDGKTVRIEIYEDGEGGWLLEVVDDYWNSTLWEDSFATDREALDEVLKTIEEEGIDALIGPPSERSETAGLNQALFDDELDELDDFLADESMEEMSMDVATLEGFLTAIAIGPRLVMPSQWLPWVWDMANGEAEATFENSDQASRMLSLIMRYYNGIIKTSTSDPASFHPIFWRGDQWGAAEWCEGFLLGFQFNDDAWSRLAASHPTWFAPFIRLGTDDGLEITKSKGDAQKWMNEIAASLAHMRAYWNGTRESRPVGTINDDFHFGGQNDVEQVIRKGPKINRNDPCPCGSGKKFKKCCGAVDTSPTLH